MRQVLLAIGVVIALLILLLIGVLLWRVLAGYIQPKTPTNKKDLVNIFVVIAAGVVGTLTAIAAVGNLIVSRRNLQNAQATLRQQRDLEDRRAQETALQAYLEQMTKLIKEGLRDEDPLSSIRLLARGRTVNLFWQLDPKRKRALLQNLHEAALINKGTPIIGLSGADLRGAYLRELDLEGADLRGAEMKGANLERSGLSGADLRGAELDGAKLRAAQLRGADLRGTSTNFRGADLQFAHLDSADLSGPKPFYEADPSNPEEQTGANLSRADLRRSWFDNANLSNAFLREVKLDHADFTGADLSGADLQNATGKTNEDLDLQAESLRGAIMPDGQLYEEWLKAKEERESEANNPAS